MGRTLFHQDPSRVNQNNVVGRLRATDEGGVTATATATIVITNGLCVTDNSKAAFGIANHLQDFSTRAATVRELSPQTLRLPLRCGRGSCQPSLNTENSIRLRPTPFGVVGPFYVCDSGSVIADRK